MKTRKDSTQIVLRELPADGRNFEFTRESGELNLFLQDLIGANPYSVKFHLQPMGNTFDLRGRLTARFTLECAVCGNELAQDVSRPLHEFILIEPGLGKGDHVGKANHAHEWEDGGPDYTVLENDAFNVAEFTHEALALAEPTRPLCAPETPGGCGHRDELPKRSWLSYDGEDAPEADVRSHPFQILEKLKLKS